MQIYSTVTLPTVYLYAINIGLVYVLARTRDSTPGFPEPRGPGVPGYFSTSKPRGFIPLNPGVSGLKCAVCELTKDPFQYITLR